MMKHLLHKARIQHLVGKRNGYLLLASGSLLLNIVLGFGIINTVGYQKIILVPPVIERPTWITAHQVSPEYLSGMGLFLANLLLNISPSNSAMQHELFLRYVDSLYYEKLKTELIIQEERLKKEHMTIGFQLSDVKVDTNKLIARISGDVSYMVGDTSMPTKHLTYAIAFNYHLGQLKVRSFEEVVDHA